MKAWWKQPYINRLQWILEHYEWFGFSEKEGLVVLMIEYLNTCQIAITPALLEQKTGLTKGSAGPGVKRLVREEISGIESGSFLRQLQPGRTLQRGHGEITEGDGTAGVRLV